MKAFYRKRWLICSPSAALIGAAAWTGSVVAQEVPAGSSPAAAAKAATSPTASPVSAPVQNDAAVGDIIVTAAKRSENLSRTPISVSALSGDQLARANIVAIKDLNAVVPNLQLSTSGFVSSIEVTLRGISTNGIFQNADPSVATYINGVYVPRTQGLNGALYDIQRVEVLRGPQGTLYGRNSTAGSINVITAPPVERFELNGDVAAGNYGDVQTHGMVNVPVDDHLALRFAFGTRRGDGYFDTLGTTAHNYGSFDDYSGRLSALWKPNEAISWLVEADAFASHGNPALGLSTPYTGDPYRQPAVRGIEPDNYVENIGIRSRFDWRLSDAWSLAYIGGYQHLRYDNIQSSNAPSPLPAGAFNGYSGQSTGRNENQSHEIDLSFDHGAFANIAGATFSREENHNLANFSFYTFGVDVDFIVPNTTQRSVGFFDQLTWRVRDTIRLTGGVRWSQDNKSTLGAGQIYCPLGTGFTGQFAFNPSCFAATGEIYGRTGQWSRVNYKAAADADLNPTTLAYASISTGYKAGGLNESNDPAFLRFAPEDVTNYELGLKTRLFNNRLQLNAAAFYMDYRNLQVAQVGGLGGVITDNAGKAQIYGTELEVVARPSRNDRFDITTTYLHATYVDYQGAVDQQFNTPAGDLTGNSLPRAPRFTFRGRYEHVFDFAAGGRITPSATFYYQTKSYLREFNKPIDLVGAYTRSSLSLRYDAPEHWALEGYVDNLENNAVRNAALTLAGLYLTYFNPPRTYGARLSYRY